MQPLKIDRCDNCGSVLQQRTLEQNDLFHAIVSDISKQKQWAGAYRTITVWKQLLSAAFERVQGRHTEVFPALDGHGIDVVYWHSSRRGKKSMSELIEYCIAWAVENGIQLQDSPIQVSER